MRKLKTTFRLPPVTAKQVEELREWYRGNRSAAIEAAILDLAEEYSEVGSEDKRDVTVTLSLKAMTELGRQSVRYGSREKAVAMAVNEMWYRVKGGESE